MEKCSSKQVLHMQTHNFVKKIEKASLFSCRAGIKLCISADFMRVACLVQKLSRFEVCMVLLPKVIGKWSAEKNFVYGLSYEVSPMFVTLPI